MGRLNKKDITLGKDLRVGNEQKKFLVSALSLCPSKVLVIMNSNLIKSICLRSLLN